MNELRAGRVVVVGGNPVTRVSSNGGRVDLIYKQTSSAAAPLVSSL